MAIVKYGAFIVDAKGSVGGTTFKRTKAGAVMQNKVTMAPVTDGKLTKADAGRGIQSGQLINMQVVVAAWKALTQSQKEDWTVFAAYYPFKNKLGEDYVASGYQCFLSLNLNLLAVNLATITAPPMLEPMPEIPDIILEMDDNDPTNTVLFKGDVPSGYVLSLDFALIYSKGRQPQLKDFRTQAIFTAGSYNKAPAWTPPPVSMNKAELIDEIAKNAKLTKADAGLVRQGVPTFPAGINIFS